MVGREIEIQFKKQFFKEDDTVQQTQKQECKQYVLDSSETDFEF